MLAATSQFNDNTTATLDSMGAKLSKALQEITNEVGRGARRKKEEEKDEEKENKEKKGKETKGGKKKTSSETAGKMKDAEISGGAGIIESQEKAAAKKVNSAPQTPIGQEEEGDATSGQAQPSDEVFSVAPSKGNSTTQSPLTRELAGPSDKESPLAQPIPPSTEPKARRENAWRDGEGQSPVIAMVRELPAKPIPRDLDKEFEEVDSGKSKKRKLEELPKKAGTTRNVIVEAKTNHDQNRGTASKAAKAYGSERGYKIAKVARPAPATVTRPAPAAAAAPKKNLLPTLPPNVEKFLTSQQKQTGCKESFGVTMFVQMIYGKALAIGGEVVVGELHRDRRLCRKCLCPLNTHKAADCEKECCGLTRCRACLHKHVSKECDCFCAMNAIKLCNSEMEAKKMKEKESM